MAGIKLSKSTLLERLDARSRSRYGGGFPGTWYETLADDGLIFPLERGENSGLAPVYFATRRHYRRALQLKRLQFLGISRRDAQIVQLFVRGYGVEPWEVREALQRELIRAFDKLRPKLRSGYFQNTRDLGDKHFASVEKQLGPLDDRFAATGLKQPREFYLRLVRVAWGATSGKPYEIIRGILIADEKSSRLPEFIERALNSDPSAYSKVGCIFTEVNRLIFRPLVGAGIIDSPEFTACAFATMLIVEKGEFSDPSFLNSLPEPRGFRNLVESARNALLRRGKI